MFDDPKFRESYKIYSEGLKECKPRHRATVFIAAMIMLSTSSLAWSQASAYAYVLVIIPLFLLGVLTLLVK